MLTLNRPPAPARRWSLPTEPARRDPTFSGPSDIWPTVALGLLGAASLLGFSRVFAGYNWVPSVFITLAGVHILCWLMRRWRLPLGAAVLTGVVVTWLVAVWFALGPFTHYGVPGAGTWDHFISALSQARTDVSSTAAPVPATAGFRILAILGAGLAAVLADAVTFRWRHVLLGAGPSFALFVVCCTSGQGSGRGVVVAAEVVGLLIYLSAQRAPGGASAQVWFAGIRTGVVRWTVGAGALLSVGAVAVAVLGTPFMHREDGVGALGWRGDLGAGRGGTRTVANPLVDLQTRLLTLSNSPVFTVESSVASYWRLTSLDDFKGAIWTSSGSYKGFGTSLPGADSAPPGTRTVQETFHIQALQSVWLPAAFNPIAVQGARNVSYDPVSNSLITSRPSSDGLQYTVTSYEYLSTLSPAALRAAPSFALPSQYLQLPGTLTPQVKALALSLTAGKKTEYDKALAIQNYLLSPLFSYNLQPLSDGTGDLAIETFLFSTRQGYCQQFAGAYAVLAREAGLPTRLAVGFSTGVAKSGTYQVLDADAHTWPEVYFGPAYGWIPFEPTPGFTDPSARRYAGGGSTVNERLSTSPTTTPGPTTTLPRDPHQLGQSATPTTLAGGSGGGRASAGGGPPVGLTVVASLAGLAFGWVAFNLARRRLRRAMRRRRSSSAGDEASVLASWTEASEMMAWRGLRQHPSETHDEYASRAARRLGWLVTDDEVPGAVTRLARLARQAAFAPRIPTGAGAEAGALADHICAGLSRSASLRQRVAWMLLPRPGFRR